MSTDDETPLDTTASPVISLQVIRGQKEAEASAAAAEVRHLLPVDVAAFKEIEGGIGQRNLELQARHDLIRQKQAEIAILLDANTLTIIQRTALYDRFNVQMVEAAKRVGINPEDANQRWNLDTATSTITRTK